MNKQKSINTLHIFVGGVLGGAMTHLAQGKLFKSQGFVKLGEKYISHYREEMQWIETFMERIAELGGDITIAPQQEIKVTTDPVEYLKQDLALQSGGVPFIRQYMAELADDPTTYNIFLGNLRNEEEDLLWMEQQVKLIETIGRENWLAMQV